MQIDKKENLKISEEFVPFYDFLNYCRACFLSIIEYVDKNHLSDEPINYKSDKDRVIFEDVCKDKDAEQWLINNGYKDVLFNFYFKHLFFSLLVDFCNYYNASIDMAFNGNIYVAWALLRKPLQETLAYIEWLYVDKDELLKLMIESNDVKSYEIMNKKNKIKIKEHIDKIQNCKSTEILDIYDFRYSYDKELTLNGILQAANHLITTRPVLKTSPSGLNFIFQNGERIYRDTGFYYTAISYVMTYTMDVIMKIFADIADLSEYTRAMNSLNLKLKELHTMSDQIDYKKAKELLELDLIPVYCPVCGQSNSSDEMWIKFAYSHFECSKCHNKINTYQYLFDFEDITFVNENHKDHNNGQV